MHLTTFVLLLVEILNLWHNVVCLTSETTLRPEKRVWLALSKVDIVYYFFFSQLDSTIIIDF